MMKPVVGSKSEETNLRIQRSAVSCLLNSQNPLDPGHNFMRGRIGRLIKVNDTILEAKGKRKQSESLAIHHKLTSIPANACPADDAEGSSRMLKGCNGQFARAAYQNSSATTATCCGMPAIDGEREGYSHKQREKD